MRPVAELAWRDYTARGLLKGDYVALYMWSQSGVGSNCYKHKLACGVQGESVVRNSRLTLTHKHTQAERAHTHTLRQSDTYQNVNDFLRLLVIHWNPIDFPQLIPDVDQTWSREERGHTQKRAKKLKLQ